MSNFWGAVQIPSRWMKRLSAAEHPRGGSFRARPGIPTWLRARGRPFWAPTRVFTRLRAQGGSFQAPAAIFATTRARSGPFRAPTAVQPGLVPGEGRSGPRRRFSPRLVPEEARSGPRPGFRPGFVPGEARFRPRPGIITLAHQKSGCQAPSGASEARAGSLRCDSKRVAAGFGAEPKFSVPHQRLAEAEQGWVVR